MKVLLAILVLLLVLGALGALAARRVRNLRGQAAPPPPDYRRRDFMSKAERAFFRVLQQAVGRGGLVFAKVRLADLLTPAGGIGNEGYQAAFNRISAKHVDFVICGPDDVVPRLAIELDDASHRQATRQERDAFIDAALHSAGLPLLRVPAQGDYVMQELRRQLAEYLEPQPQGRGQELPPVSQASRTQELPAAPVARAAAAPTCPKCGAGMVARKGQSGALAGKEFWGCSTFPRCHGLLPKAATA
jgi:hypothetical protein